MEKNFSDKSSENLFIKATSVLLAGSILLALIPNTVSFANGWEAGKADAVIIGTDDTGEDATTSLASSGIIKHHNTDGSDTVLFDSADLKKIAYELNRIDVEAEAEQAAWK